MRVLNLDMPTGIEEVTVGIEPVLGVVLKEQSPRVFKVALGSFLRQAQRRHVAPQAYPAFLELL